jgi:hypothetical protein
MRLVTFSVKTMVGSVQRIEALHGQQIIDLHAVYASYLRQVRGIYRWREMAQAILPADMLKFIEGGELAMEADRLALDYLGRIGSLAEGQGAERHVYQLSEVKLMAPVPRPVSIRDCSTFPQHSMNMQAAKQPAAELPQIWYEIPAHYRTSSTDVAGPDAPILCRAILKNWTMSLKLPSALVSTGLTSLWKRQRSIF